LLEGKAGTLTIRELREEWVDCGTNENAGVIPAVEVGPRTVVRGTGQYKGVTGGGKSARAGLGNPWYARRTGSLTSP
jgi:hypothetical protein